MHEVCGSPSTLSPPFPSTSSSSHSSFISRTSSCISSTTLRAVASLCTLAKHVWTLLTTPTSSQNYKICQRTKIIRAPCRRRNGGAVLRAEGLGDLVAAGHKVLSENCESRNNHRYAIVVQDFATQWIQSYPCKTKTSQGIIARLHHTDRRLMGLLREQCAE